MILNDIVELCKAGFSKEEILKMLNPALQSSTISFRIIRVSSYFIFAD